MADATLPLRPTKADLTSEIHRLRWWLEHIRRIAACSEGVEFYSFLAGEALRGRPAIDLDP